MENQFICQSWFYFNGVKTCSNGQKSCPANSVCGMTTPIVSTPLQGWICPRCGSVHSPFTTTCGCPPPTVTYTGVSTGCPYRVQNSCTFKGQFCNNESCDIKAQNKK